MIDIKKITSTDLIWADLISYAQNCSWKAGAALANDMTEGKFTGWERVFVAVEGDRIAGYCTFSDTDCVPDVPYHPYIGYVFVDEDFRGHRLSEQMIRFALDYAGELGFESVYLVSDHINLYEKYGFVKVDEKPDRWGRSEKIYQHGTKE